jgi:hypothetical protein
VLRPHIEAGLPQCLAPAKPAPINTARAPRIPAQLYPRLAARATALANSPNPTTQQRTQACAASSCTEIPQQDATTPLCWRTSTPYARLKHQRLSRSGACTHLIPCLHAVVQRVKGTSVSQRERSTARAQHALPTSLPCPARRHAVVQRYRGAVVPWYCGTVVPSCVLRAPQEREKMDALLARIGPSERAEVEALWSGMQSARASCESMAVRGQRLIREVTSEWQVRREAPASCLFTASLAAAPTVPSGIHCMMYRSAPTKSSCLAAACDSSAHHASCALPGFNQAAISTMQSERPMQ